MVNLTTFKLKNGLAAITFLAVVVLTNCSNTPKSPAVADNVRQALDAAGLKSVSVSQDRDKGVVTLTGNVPSDTAKAQAESIAAPIANGQVVANEVAVVPPADRSDAKAINSDLDKGINDNVDAALIQNGFRHVVKFNVKNGVVTLTGEVNSEDSRAQAEKIASSVPNVQQVVNELQVKDQKATATLNQTR